MGNEICKYCETRENGYRYCTGHKTIITCCGYPSLKKEECLVYQLKTENEELKDRSSKLQYAVEELWDAAKAYEDLHGFLDCTYEIMEKQVKEVLDNEVEHN